MPRIAVVIPCFNDGGTLGEALGSLEQQESHELVVVDDGSEEAETLYALAALEERGIKVIHRENGGLSAARMAGVAETTAPYVFPLDADDAVVPDALSPLADALDATKDAALAWGDVEVWGEIEIRLAAGHRLDPWQISYLNTLPVASLVRREALLAVGGWQLRHGYEDWDLWMAFAEQGWRGVHVPRPTLRYRRRSGRMLEGCIPRHGELYAELQQRHQRLFRSRRRNWFRSRAPVTTRLLFPAISMLPLSEFDKSRLFQLTNAPRQFLAIRRLRRRAPTSAATDR